MDEFDLKAIWQGSEQDEEALPSVTLTAQQHNDQSLNLVEQIKSTARMEHRLFLIIAAIGIIVLVIFQLYYWALGLFFFAALDWVHAIVFIGLSLVIHFLVVA